MSDATTANRKPTHQVVATYPGATKRDPLFLPIGTGWESEKGTIWLDFELMPTDMNASIGVRALTDSIDESS